MKTDAYHDARLGRLEAQKATAVSSSSSAPVYSLRYCTGLSLTSGTDWRPLFDAATVNVVDLARPTAGGEIFDGWTCDRSYQKRYSLQFTNSGLAKTVSGRIGEGPNSGCARTQIWVNDTLIGEFTSGTDLSFIVPSGAVNFQVLIDSDGDGVWLAVQVM